MVCANLNTGDITSIVGDQVVVKCDAEPPVIGAQVMGGRGRIGVVADVIGPVGKPYYVIKLDPNAKVKVGDRVRSG
jgi:rRNA processing protein Gar1